MKRISEVIDNLVSSNPKLRKLKLFSVKAAWEQAVGSVVSKRAKVADIIGNTLVILCKDPMWMGEVLLRKKKILEKMNKIFGKEVFTEIKIKQR